MTLTAVDDDHFYIGGHLIDLVWISYQVRKKTTAANYHNMNRSLIWLRKFALRLLAGEAEPTDETTARKMLTTLGYGWYFE